ncbi:hypothetical protein AB0911_17490, partial [Streptomyces nigra]|uniref:hypothetical protein n=1 Tax=Streptomyces nigra TaxID=1827580 RepID=UPI003453453E
PGPAGPGQPVAVDGTGRHQSDPQDPRRILRVRRREEGTRQPYRAGRDIVKDIGVKRRELTSFVALCPLLVGYGM